MSRGQLSLFVSIATLIGSYLLLRYICACDQKKDPKKRVSRVPPFRVVQDKVFSFTYKGRQVHVRRKDGVVNHPRMGRFKVYRYAITRSHIRPWRCLDADILCTWGAWRKDAKKAFLEVYREAYPITGGGEE